MGTKDTAAPTAAAHERLTEREGARMKAVADARKVEGRRRQGLTSREEKDIVAKLKDGADWGVIEKRYGREIEPEVLAGWRKELERRASSEPVPRMPRTGQPE